MNTCLLGKSFDDYIGKKPVLQLCGMSVTHHILTHVKAKLTFKCNASLLSINYINSYPAILLFVLFCVETGFHCATLAVLKPTL